MSTTEITTASPKKGFSQLLDSPAIKQRIQEVLKDRSTQFVTSALSLFNSDAKLSACDPASLFNACLTATSLGLPINNNLGFAYIIPYGSVAQFQIGYKGFRQLAINSNQYRSLDVKPVYEGQLVEDDSFKGFHFDWKAKTSNTVIGYASYFQLLNGFENVYYLDIAEINQHAKKYSQTFKKYGSGLWKDDFEKMAKKTVVKLHLNSGFAPLSIEMQKAQLADQSVVGDNEQYTYIDNEPETLQDAQEEEENNRTMQYLDQCESLEELKKLKEEVPSDVLDRLSGAFDNRENELILLAENQKSETNGKSK